MRGAGLMVGMVMEEPCRPLALKLMERGLLVSATAMNVIRLVPPLIITKGEVDEIVSILRDVLDEGMVN